MITQSVCLSTFVIYLHNGASFEFWEIEASYGQRVRHNILRWTPAQGDNYMDYLASSVVEVDIIIVDGQDVGRNQ